MPQVYIRTGIAHIVKIYATFLKGVHQSIRNLYLGAIGKLVIARSRDEARDILLQILTVARATYQGRNSEGRLTKCSVAKEQLKNLLTRKADLFHTGNTVVDDALKSLSNYSDHEGKRSSLLYQLYYKSSS